MPCEKPGIIPIDDSCCFSCFTTGRGQYDAPIAIVLHEVDYHLEALNNKLENCCDEDPECHKSFHYGVGADGRVINWVDPSDTAWAFDPNPNDADCGLCGWSIATQEGTSVDANLYTINIAVATGISAIVGGQTRANNAYSDAQYDRLTRLVGWLADTYGIIVNQNNVWRHCDELSDFPGSCDKCFTYAKFLEDVQDCIDSPDYTCDYPPCTCLQNAEPTTPGPCDLSAWTGLGCQEDDCDCDCDDCVCNCPEVTNVDFCTSEDPATMTSTGLPFETCIVDGMQGINLRLDDGEQSNTVVLEFPEEQTNLQLCFAQFGNTTDEEITFTPAPNSVDGDLVLNGAVVTSGVDGGSGCVIWNGPVETVTFVYGVSDAIAEGEEHSVCLNQMQSDGCYCETPAPLQAGMTVMGCDCKCYTFTDVAGLVDFCDLMQGAVPAATEDAVPGQTMLLSRDCNSYFLPDICEQLEALAVRAQPDELLIPVLHEGDCEVSRVTFECDPTDMTASALGINSVGEIGIYRPRPSLPDRSAINGGTLQPATDGVVFLDAENGPVIFTLTAPGPCDPTDYWIKRKDCNDQNTVTINGGANTIDTLPAIQLGTPGPYGGCGEAVHLHWDGNDWSIL